MNKLSIKKYFRKVRLFINRSGIGYFAPLLAIMRMIKQRRFNYIHQMKVFYRYAYWSVCEPKFITYSINEFIDEFYPGKRAAFDAEEKLRKEAFLKSLRPRTKRPTDLRQKPINDSNQEFHFQWRANFKTKVLLIFTPSLWQPAIADFLIALPSEDSRFAESGISDPLQIDAYFTIKICQEYNDKERWFLAHVSMSYGCWDITLVSLPKKLHKAADIASKPKYMRAQ